MNLKHLWIVLGVAATALALPVTANAAAPTRTVSSSVSDTVYPAGTYCDFAIERIVAAQVKTLECQASAGTPHSDREQVRGADLLAEHHHTRPDRQERSQA